MPAQAWVGSEKAEAPCAGTMASLRGRWINRPELVSPGKAISAAGLTQAAIVKLLVALRVSTGRRPWPGLAAVLRITAPARVTGTTRGAGPAGARKTTNTDPRGSNSSGTRGPPATGAKAAAG